MTEPRKLRVYGYVDRPYEKVRALLRSAALPLFVRATTSAARRADELIARLRVGVQGFEIGVDVAPTVLRVQEEESVAGLPPVLRVDLTWEAADSPAMFPIMRAVLSVWPVTSDETQIEVEGEYRPPLGRLGSALDAVLLHRVAEASVHRLLEDLGAQLERELA